MNNVSPFKYTIAGNFGIMRIRDRSIKWSDKSTTSYDLLNFTSYIKNVQGKYLVIERHMLQLQGILFQYLKVY